MLKKDRYRAFVDYFSTNQPNAETELNFNSSFELLIAVILSAQCTDKRINQVTPALFNRFPTPESLAKTTPEEVFGFIRSVSYPNNKAKHLVGMAKILVQEFNGIVPADIDDLQKMPGVGRKTANVIASVIYQAPAMAVDTHVFRVANRIGLTYGRTPLAVEKQLVKNLPTSTIHLAHHWLILHGRYICVARNPKCAICPLTAICKYFQQSQTETALKKIAADQIRKTKQQRLQKVNHKIHQELTKRSVEKEDLI